MSWEGITLERTTSLSVSPVASPLEATVHYQFGCFERETALLAIEIPSAEALGIVVDSLPKVEAVIVKAHLGVCQFGRDRGCEVAVGVVCVRILVRKRTSRVC